MNALAIHLYLIIRYINLSFNYFCNFYRIIVMIRSGNKDYSVEIKDPSILDVKIDLSSPIGMGNLDIYPKQKEKQLFK